MEEQSATTNEIVQNVAEAAKGSEEISEIITKINGYQTGIASSVEEQSATTNEIVRNVAEAAKGSGEITENINSVASAAENTSTAVVKNVDLAKELSSMAADLDRQLKQFKFDSAETGLNGRSGRNVSVDVDNGEADPISNRKQVGYQSAETAKVGHGEGNGNGHSHRNVSLHVN